MFIQGKLTTEEPGPVTNAKERIHTGLFFMSSYQTSAVVILNQRISRPDNLA